MAAFDIMPWTSSLGQAPEVRYGAMTAGATFQVGEMVGFVSAGSLSEAPADDTQFILADLTAAGTSAMRCGVACFGPGAASAAADPRNSVAINPRTGNAFATGDTIAYWPADQGTLFITDNFTAAGAGSAVAPAVTDIGEAYQITYATFGTPDSGWGVEQTAGVAATDVFAAVVDVLDATKVPIGLTGNAGVFVVFEIRTGA